MLEIRQSSISDAKRRRSIPAEWYIKLYDKFGLSLDWLRWRSGPMYSKDKASVVPDVPDDATFSSGLREDPAPGMTAAQGGLSPRAGHGLRLHGRRCRARILLA